MGIGRLIPFLLAAAGLLAGCAESPEDCTDSEVWHGYEEFCASAVQPWEICNAHHSGNADNAVSCAAHSKDGQVWLDVNIQGQGSAQVTVTDPTGAIVHDRTYTANAVTYGLEFAGAKGSWILDVDYDDAGGSSLIVLYG